MTVDFITKRPHKKSRGGCKTCKTKKVKCDEAQPKCTFCKKRNLTCIYVSKPSRPNLITPPSSQNSGASSRSNSPFGDDGVSDIDISWELVSSPQPQIMSSSGGLSPIDLRVMHHWSTATYNTLLYGESQQNVMHVTVPQLAFENEFLLNGMLGIASLHMQYLLPNPEDYRKQTDIYRVKALNSFRQALTRLDTKSRSYDAALVMSILLLVLCCKDNNPEEDELGIVNWLLLYRGLSSVITLRSFVAVQISEVAPIFRRQLTELKSTPEIPTVLLKMLEEITPLDIDYEGLEYYCHTLDTIGVLYASLRQDGLGPALYIRIITWGSFCKKEFADFARQRRPRVLVILAYYVVFMKLLKGLWYLEGFADQQIRSIARILDPEWLPFLEVPLQAIQMTSEEEIASLMLR